MQDSQQDEAKLVGEKNTKQSITVLVTASIANNNNTCFVQIELYIFTVKLRRIKQPGRLGTWKDSFS